MMEENSIISSDPNVEAPEKLLSESQSEKKNNELRRSNSGDITPIAIATAKPTSSTEPNNSVKEIRETSPQGRYVKVINSPFI